jgi:2-polyprenyl-3-methyl-5-hydroxy-6-metoxy-1,4-benzoquinol methylase
MLVASYAGSALAKPGRNPMLSSLIGIHVHETEITRHQRALDAFFRDRSQYWKHVYQEDTLSGLIKRERQSAVLRMVDRLELPKGARVLEVGCGAGLTAVALARRGFTVEAIDTVGAMLDLTRHAAIDAGVSERVTTSTNSVLEMSFPAQHFDLAVAMGVIPWLECAGNALLQLSRVLKPGGHIILTADNHWCLNQIFDPLCFPGLRRLRWKIGDALERRGLHLVSRPRLYWRSVKQIDELLGQCGFCKLKGITLGFGAFTFFKRRLTPDKVGIALHREFQSLADRQFPGIRSAGKEYVVIARKLRTV